MSDVVRDSDDQTARIEEVARETESPRALAPHNLDNLGQLDDAASQDNSKSEDLGDGVADAVGRIKVGVPDERRVAFLNAIREDGQHACMPVEPLLELDMTATCSVPVSTPPPLRPHPCTLASVITRMVCPSAPDSALVRLLYTRRVPRQPPVAAAPSSLPTRPPARRNSLSR